MTYEQINVLAMVSGAVVNAGSNQIFVVLVRTSVTAVENPNSM
mgnify:CR=1 FL=1